MSTSILIVDDEEDLREMVALKLQREGFEVREAKDGLVGLAKAKRRPPDLVVLDVMMPNMDGHALARELAKDGRTASVPILFLTAKTGADDRIEGLELGADDYLSKPFSPKELVLRVKAILRRSEQAPATAVTEYDGFHLDKNHLKFYLDGEEIELTSTEFKLLLAFIETPGVIKERGDLLQSIWGYSRQINTRTLDTHVKRLREKLGDKGERIETIRGVGYRFAENSSSC